MGTDTSRDSKCTFRREFRSKLRTLVYEVKLFPSSPICNSSYNVHTNSPRGELWYGWSIFPQPLSDLHCSVCILFAWIFTQQLNNEWNTFYTTRFFYLKQNDSSYIMMWSIFLYVCAGNNCCWRPYVFTPMLMNTISGFLLTPARVTVVVVGENSQILHIHTTTLKPDISFLLEKDISMNSGCRWILHFTYMCTSLRYWQAPYVQNLAIEYTHTHTNAHTVL